MTTHITDTVSVAGARLTDEGYLVANARTARTGIQTYLGSEMGRADLETVNVLRDEAEVFSKASLNTFSRIPVTMDHPAGGVDAGNWRDLAVGTTGDEVLRDGEYLKIGLKITDAKAVKAIQDGKRELSVGYGAEIVWEDGIAPDGTPYQARQTGIRANHIAIVDRGRAGALARIGDHEDAGKDRANWGATPLHFDRKDDDMTNTVNTRTVLIDGLSVETTDAGAQALEKLQRTISDKDAAMVQLNADHKSEIDAKDAEIAKKDAEIDKLKKSQLSDADLDARVAARAKLIGGAKAIDKDVKTDGIADAEIRKAVVAAKLGDDAIKDRSDAYIEARFDVLAEDAAKGDQFSQHMQTTPRAAAGSTIAHTAYAENVTDMTTAWMGDKAKKEA